MRLDPEEIRAALARRPNRLIAPGDLRPAAVLLPLFVKDDESHLLFTRRTDHLPHHRGEISFPGGGRHPGDADLLATALRETEEEMGIRPGDVSVLGRLDDIVSIHGYHVVPYVGTYPYPYPYRVNAREIAEVIELPLRALADPGAVRREDWRHRGRRQAVWFYTVGGHVIWGLTGAVLREFLRRTGFASSLAGAPGSGIL